MYFLNKKEHLYFTIKLNGFKESKEIKLFRFVASFFHFLLNFILTIISLKDEAEGRKGAKKRKESVVLHSEGEAKVNTLTLTLDYVYDSHSMSTKVKILTRCELYFISGIIFFN